MADTITPTAVKQKFACGQDYTNLTVVNFEGPGGSKLCAYCCNTNIDLDGEPQAYAPESASKLRPMDNLGNAGYKSPGQNETLKKEYEDGPRKLAELEGQQADMVRKGAQPGGPGAAQAKKDPALVALETKIARLKAHLKFMSFEHIDANGNASKTNPKNFEKIFWKWYGCVALTPDQASKLSYLEMPALNLTVRKPVLDQTAKYEDVFGRFPVVQSVFEPGPGYYVTALPRAANGRYPSWDQRYYLPPDANEQTPFGALSKPLAHATGLKLYDMVFAVRLDSSRTLTFPFRDSGNDYKVAECSFGTFVSLGGEYHPEKRGAAKFPNNFLVLYLAFPGGQSPTSVLSKFAGASNAAEFPIMLSFIAQATTDAKAKHSHVVSGDPLAAYGAWKKTNSTVKPSTYEVVSNALSTAGSEFVQRYLSRHPGLLSGGAGLQLKP